MAVHSFFVFPETAGKTLEEVEDMFLKKTPAWKTRVETARILAVEHGELSPEKLAQFGHGGNPGVDSMHEAATE
jgi:hypothetical protein